MSRYLDLPFVQAGGHGGAREATQCVVIHCTDNTAPASGEANYARTRDDGVSAHFYSDEAAVIQALDTDLVAYGCYPTGNSRSVQFELVGRSNAVTDATLRHIAPIVARVCAQYAIPIRHVGPAELRAGAKGICGHGDVTRAWGEGDHTDPGDSFPWATFIGYVQAATGGGTMAGEADAAFVKPYTGIESWISDHSWMAKAVEAPLRRLEAAAARDEARDAAMTAAITALSRGGASIDTAVVLAAIDKVGVDAHRVVELEQQLADRDARLAAALRPAGS